MKEKIKSLNIVQILSNILMIISFIVLFVTKDKIQNFIIGLFWESIILIVLGTMWFLYKWTKNGVNADVTHSKKILTELDNITIAWVVCFVVAFLVVMFITNIKPEYRNNLYIISGTFIMSLITQIIVYIAEEKAYKETVKIISKNKIGKNDSNDTKK